MNTDQHSIHCVPTHAITGRLPLAQWGVIRVTGDDAVSFLHNQITQDVALLPVGQARLGAYCSPKGRMLTSFIVLKHDVQEIWLVCPRAVLSSSLKRLSMFVLRAKVKIEDASEHLHVYALMGQSVPDPLQTESANALPWQTLTENGAHTISLYPAQQMSRALWVGTQEQATQASLDAAPVSTLTPEVWAWAETRSAVAHITAPELVDAFVPQMLNYESIGGVNFKKGCYPGQEVVARSQFRGTLKRRTYLLHWAVQERAVPPAGSPLFARHSDTPEDACGTVLQAAYNPDHTGMDVLAVLPTSVAEQATNPGLCLSLSHPQDPALHLEPLPYALLDDI